MRNLPESRHAPKLRVMSQKTASVRSATGRKGTRLAALSAWRRANGIKRSTTIRTSTPQEQIRRAGARQSVSTSTGAGDACGEPGSEVAGRDGSGVLDAECEGVAVDGLP